MDDGVYDAAVDAVTAGRQDVQECSTNNVPHRKLPGKHPAIAACRKTLDVVQW
jgi:hypothetical protein